MLELRPRQVECLESIRNEYLAGTYQQLVVAATGIGKAVILANIRRHMLDLLRGVQTYRRDCADTTRALHLFTERRPAATWQGVQ